RTSVERRLLQRLLTQPSRALLNLGENNRHYQREADSCIAVYVDEPSSIPDFPPADLLCQRSTTQSSRLGSICSYLNRCINPLSQNTGQESVMFGQSAAQDQDSEFFRGHCHFYHVRHVCHRVQL